MRYNPEDQKREVLLFGMMCGSDIAIDRAEKEEQYRVINECELPKSMKPNQVCFEKLGFCFEDIGDDVMLKAKLPEGWSMKAEDSYHTNILDEKGRVRAAFFYKGVFYARTGHMVAYCRYGVKSEVTIKGNIEDGATVFVYDRNNDSIVKKFGSFPDSWCDEHEKAREDAYKWLKEHFPSCEDPTAYWDE